MPARRFLLLLLFAASAPAADIGPSTGTLIAVGGGMRDPTIFERFLQLAGGPDSPVVVIPTAAGEDYTGPDWAGIGIDENTAIVVKGDSFEVIGQGYFAIYDAARSIPPHGLFYLLAPGDRYDLKTRKATRGNEPAERVKEKPWND